MKQQHAGLQRIAGTCCSQLIVPEGPKRQRLHQMPTCQAEPRAGRGQRGTAERPGAEQGPRDPAEPGDKPKPPVPQGWAQLWQREHPRAPPGTARPALPAARAVLGLSRVTEMLENAVCVTKYFVKLV